MSLPTTILATLALLLKQCREAGIDPFVALKPEGGGGGFYTGLQWGSPLFHSLEPIISQHVAKGTTILTDGWSSYKDLEKLGKLFALNYD